MYTHSHTHVQTHIHTHHLSVHEQFETGTDVAKVFWGALFRGFIIDIDSDEDDGTVLYKIEYEDEDQEDMSPRACTEAIKLHEQIENGEIDEWTIGNE